MKSLVLYKYDTCPYCQRVMRYISTSGRKDVVYKDIHKDLMAERVGGSRRKTAGSVPLY